MWENKVEEPWQYDRSLNNDAMSDGRSHFGYFGIAVHTM